jgi:site-specific DNA-methyltransferase (adenine-specific)
MFVFCSWEQLDYLKEKAAQYGFPHSELFVFRKSWSPQVLKANMRPCGNFECALQLYRGKLPKFRNDGHMQFTCREYVRDTTTPKVHPTQKSIHVMRDIIEMFTDPGDVVIDPVAGSGVSLLAAEQLGRKAYGFEIKKEYVQAYETKLSHDVQTMLV